MGYGFSPETIRGALNELRWKFDKGREYPEMGFWHPNLLIEDAIDMIGRLAAELDRLQTESKTSADDR